MATIAIVPGAKVKHTEADPTTQTFNVGTRKSNLALVQTDIVVKALAVAWPDHVFHIKARDTAAGDIDKITPFKDMPVKNLWTHELETLMMEGKLDILVHSLKDVPTQIPLGCEIGGITMREDPRDAFVIKAGRNPCGIAELPTGSVIGTSSIRRTAQIALKYPHLRVMDVRGNIGTRLSKLDAEDSPFDALILAAAGLLRLDLGSRISQFLDSKNGGMLYAVGQGAIGMENRSNDPHTQEMLSSITHIPTHLECLTERSLLRTLEGGCSAPLGVETSWSVDTSGAAILRLKAIVVSVNGKESVEIDMMKPVETVVEAEAYGLEGAAELLRKGADRILAAIKAKQPTEIMDL